MTYPIIKNCTSSKDYPVNELEEHFFNTLWCELSEQNKFIKLIRMSDGSLSVQYNNFPVGKIKLQGRKYWMQILKGLYTSKTVEGDVEVFIQHIPDWVKYIQKYCK